MWYLTAFIMTLICSEPVLVIDRFTHVFTLSIKQCDLFLGSWSCAHWEEANQPLTSSASWLLFPHPLPPCFFLHFWYTVIKYNISETTGGIWCYHFILIHVWALLFWTIFFIFIFYNWAEFKIYLRMFWLHNSWNCLFYVL